MPLDGEGADAEPLADLLIADAVGDEAEHFDFTRREPARRCGRRGGDWRQRVGARDEERGAETIGAAPRRAQDDLGRFVPPERP